MSKAKKVVPLEKPKSKKALKVVLIVGLSVIATFLVAVMVYGIICSNTWSKLLKQYEKTGQLLAQLPSYDNRVSVDIDNITDNEVMIGLFGEDGCKELFGECENYAEGYFNAIVKDLYTEVATDEEGNETTEDKSAECTIKYSDFVSLSDYLRAEYEKDKYMYRTSDTEYCVFANWIFNRTDAYICYIISTLLIEQSSDILDDTYKFFIPDVYDASKKAFSETNVCNITSELSTVITNNELLERLEHDGLLVDRVVNTIYNSLVEMYNTTDGTETTGENKDKLVTSIQDENGIVNSLATEYSKSDVIIDLSTSKLIEFGGKYCNMMDSQQVQNSEELMTLSNETTELENKYKSLSLLWPWTTSEDVETRISKCYTEYIRAQLPDLTESDQKFLQDRLNQRYWTWLYIAGYQLIIGEDDDTISMDSEINEKTYVVRFNNVDCGDTSIENRTAWCMAQRYFIDYLSIKGGISETGDLQTAMGGITVDTEKADKYKQYLTALDYIQSMYTTTLMGMSQEY